MTILAHTGAELWGGRFWDSPDLWIRNADDGGTTHQAPIAGRDNWFHARVRNRGTGTARHFMVTFQVRQFAGVQFTWPSDFLPAIAATGGFDLAPGTSRIVQARWPAKLVPPAGTHACWLAAVLARSDRPKTGAHVWEHGNLAQKNLTVIKIKRGLSFVLPFVLKGLKLNDDKTLELVRPAQLALVGASLVPRLADPRPAPPDVSDALDHGHFARRRRGDQVLDADDRAAMTDAGFDADTPRPFPPGQVSRLPVRLPMGQTMLGLMLRVGADLQAGSRGTIDLVLRDTDGKPAGGIAVELTVLD